VGEIGARVTRLTGLGIDRFEIILEEGLASETIPKCAERWLADLVIVGWTGRVDGIVVDAAPCSVLVVRSNMPAVHVHPDEPDQEDVTTDALESIPSSPPSPQ
jgi:hypothetical protein